jgi:hypothetical protein
MGANILSAGAVRLFSAGTLALLLCLTGCGDGSSGGSTPAPTPTPTPSPTPSPTPTPTPSPTPRPAQVEREVTPFTVNPGLPASDVPNFEINPDPAVAPKGRLFVMLPGTGAAPRNYRTVVRTGAARGYHGVGLTYVNGTAVAELCSTTTTDLDCAGNARREIITGENVSTLVTVSANSSVAGRLAALLDYLNRTYPAEGWGQFLSGGAVNWSLVTVAGHSQGAGHAGYMTKLYSLDRAVMFSGPADVPAAGQTAARWFSLPNVTSTSRQYGFTHGDDEIVPYSLVRANWTAIGLGSATPFLVDGAAAPYGGGNLLYTQAAPSIAGGSRHSSPVADVFTPLNAQGAPIYAPVWNYMAFP